MQIWIAKHTMNIKKKKNYCQRSNDSNNKSLICQAVNTYVQTYINKKELSSNNVIKKEK